MGTLLNIMDTPRDLIGTLGDLRGSLEHLMGTFGDFKGMPTHPSDVSVKKSCMSIFYQFVLIPNWIRNNPLVTLSDFIVTPGYLKGGLSNLTSAQSNIGGTQYVLLTLKMTFQVHQWTPQKPLVAQKSHVYPMDLMGTPGGLRGHANLSVPM